VLDSRSLTLLLLSIRPIKSITTLTLFNAGLGPAAFKALEDGLGATPIGNLQLDYNPLDENDENVKSLIRAVTGPSSKLVSLSLRGNRLGAAAAGWLAEGLKANSSLQSLNLFDNKMGDEAAAALVSGLHTNGVLGDLSLANNEVGPQGAKAFQELFEGGGGKALQLLNLTSNRLDANAVSSLLTALVARKEGLGGLKALALHRNKAGQSQELAALAKSLEPVHVSV
jgi:Ran GTPase-activating protein (RanGAP) involved in mRNA processing and transport